MEVSELTFSGLRLISRMYYVFPHKYVASQRMDTGAEFDDEIEQCSLAIFELGEEMIKKAHL